MIENWAETTFISFFGILFSGCEMRWKEHDHSAERFGILGVQSLDMWDKYEQTYLSKKFKQLTF